jgi:hypothetical protein
MAHWNELEWKDDVYAAADIWNERCFLNDTALFNDKSIWTQENFEKLKAFTIDDPILGGGSFEEKLKEQLSKATDPGDLFQLSAELIWFTHLISTKIGPETKKGYIGLVISPSVFSPESREQFLSEQVLSGIANPGREYIRNKFTFWIYLVIMLSHWKSLPQNERNTFRGDDESWRFAEWWDGIWDSNFDDLRKELCPPITKRYIQKNPQIRHCLMFFLFPERFERAVSASDKEQILRDLIYLVDKGQIAEFLGAGGYESQIAIDRAIFNLRSVLELVHDRTNLDFYKDPIKGSWGKRGPLSMGTNRKLRNYIESPNDHSFVTLRNSLLNQEGSAENDNRSVTNALEAGIAASGLPEGEAKVVMQIIRERDQTLRRRKLNEVIGEIRCECCDTRGDAYQRLQKEIPKERIFEIHHLIPISQYDGAKITDLDEVALLCANCHRAIHTFPNDQMPSVDEFRQQLQKKSE